MHLIYVLAKLKLWNITPMKSHLTIRRLIIVTGLFENFKLPITAISTIRGIT